MNITNEQIIEAWKRTRNYAQVGRELGLARNSARRRIMELRAAGTDLPPSQPVGYILKLDSDRARELARLSRQNER